MSAAALLASEIPADVTGWLVSEKYDGIRAIWTGTRLMTRSGKTLRAPAWFLRGLPADVRLDGEVWMGRNTFPALQSTLQRAGSDWRGVRFMVFDLAEQGAFEARNERLAGMEFPDHVQVVRHHRISGHEELAAMERAVVFRGGEGLVIRRPGSRYRPGRCGDVVKVKRLVDDLDRWQG